MENLSIRSSSTTDATPENIAHLTRLINEVYTISEGPLWVKGHLRTTQEGVQHLLSGGHLLLASIEGELCGCIEVHVDKALRRGSFGMLTADPVFRGQGLGSKLVTAAEQHAKASGCDTMQLELLIPRNFDHPDKVFLHSWYTRIGYVQDRVMDLLEKHPEKQGKLITPCDLTVYLKSL